MSGIKSRIFFKKILELHAVTIITYRSWHEQSIPVLFIAIIRPTLVHKGTKENAKVEKRENETKDKGKISEKWRVIVRIRNKEQKKME